VTDDPDMRARRAQRAVLGHRLQRLAIPRVADHGRKCVALAREHLHHLHELRLDDQLALLTRRPILAVVGDLGDQPLARTHPRADTALHEGRVNVVHERLDVIPCRALPSLRTRAHEHDKLVAVMAGGLHRVMGTGAGRGAERDQEL
jgi:hypothetical protein